MPSVVDEIREAYATSDDDVVRTHSFECHLWHPRCAIRVLLDVLDKMDKHQREDIGIRVRAERLEAEDRAAGRFL